MKYSFNLANKIRTKLLLFTDEEMRSKKSNISSLSKIKDNYNTFGEINTQEVSFSNTQKDDILYFNKKSNLDSSPKFLLNTYCKCRSQIEPIINSEFKKHKSIIENPKSNGIYLKNQKYLYKSHKKQNNKMIFSKAIKHKKQRAKEYLNNLCKNLINKSQFNGYYHSNSNIPKKPKISIKSPKSKQLKKNVEKKKELEQSSNNICSFKIILFACDACDY